ncbi:MAG: two component transcriptional regulator, winged helix family [Bacteroidetes bacterium]|nr:two component transcriptional regulator, winged helix family [Bacteroidota bacterium]
MKLLLVEDEKNLADSIVTYLKQAGYVCETANDFASADEKTSLYQYDCILVDITLPGGNGLELIKKLKKSKTKSGIIIISAKNSVDDKIAGLDLGADDYIAKPFNLAELNSRIRSVLRRRNFEGDKEVSFNEISIKPDNQMAFVNNAAITLTKKEYDLLLFFITNKNRVLTKETIAGHLWGDDMDMADSYDFIYTHIKNLRKKLVDKGSGDYVKTVYGMGYKFGN